MTSQLCETSKELLCLSAEQLSQHTCCDLLRNILDGSPHQLLRPAPRHLQKSAIPEGFLNSKAELQLHIKGEASVFKQSAPEAAGSGSRETKKTFILPSPTMSSCPGSQPTRGLSRVLGAHPSPPCNPWDLQAWRSPQASPHQAGPPCRGGTAPEETATHLAQRGIANALRTNRSNLPSGSVPAAGKRVFVWEDTISGQRPARLSCFCSCSASLLATGTTSLSGEVSSTCTQTCVLTHRLPMVQAMPGQQLSPRSEQTGQSPQHQPSCLQEKRQHVGVHSLFQRHFCPESG